MQRTCYHTVGKTERIKGESEVTQKLVTTHGRRRRKVRKWGYGAHAHAHCCAAGVASQPGWEGERAIKIETTKEGLCEPCWDHEEVPADQEGLPRWCWDC